jgi:hypothetical protein
VRSICANDDQFWDMINMASEHAYRTDHQDIIYEKLRFLTPIQPKGRAKFPFDGTANDSSQCSFADFNSIGSLDSESDSTPILALTTLGAVSETKQYVAVSYCWKACLDYKSHPLNSTAPSSYIIQTAYGDRRNIAPANVIHRAISYTAKHNLHFIWID